MEGVNPRRDSSVRQPAVRWRRWRDLPVEDFTEVGLHSADAYTPRRNLLYRPCAPTGRYWPLLRRVPRGCRRRHGLQRWRDSNSSVLLVDIQPILQLRHRGDGNFEVDRRLLHILVDVHSKQAIAHRGRKFGHRSGFQTSKFYFAVAYVHWRTCYQQAWIRRRCLWHCNGQHSGAYRKSGY